MTPLDGRSAAVLTVTEVLTGRGFVAEGLREMRAAGRLADREAALAMETGLGTVRHVLTIDHVLSRIARFDRRRTPPLLRAVLYTAAYQVIWMDRVPVFAAVDEAVEAARQLVGGRAPRMVNAVLRRLTAAVAERSAGWQRLARTQVRTDWRRACIFNTPVLPETEAEAAPIDHLAPATGERPERFAELCQRWGLEQAEAVAWASQATPVLVLQRNPLRATPEAFEQHVRSACGAEVEFVDEAAYAPVSVAIMDTPAFRDGLVYVQDSAAHAAAAAVAAQPGERILDVCAAPGGKSVALALAMNDRGTIVACDCDPRRLGRVTANAVRLGLSCIRTRVAGGAGVELDEVTGLFDGVLVDVPCSNTGVIARRPEARLGLTARKLESLAKAQDGLLRGAAEHVRPGGRLVYSTCSVEPEENERRVAGFLSERAGWRLDCEQTTLPQWGPRLADWRDGGYVARLVRAGT